MPGSEDLFKEGKPAQGDSGELVLDRKPQSDEPADEVVMHVGEGKFFEGASSFMGLPDNEFQPDAVEKNESVDTVFLEAGKALDSLVSPSLAQIQPAEDLPQSVDPASETVPQFPQVEKVDVNQLLEPARAQFKNGDYVGCLKTLDAGLHEDPTNYHMTTLLKEAQRKHELQRAEEELADQITSIKSEAVELFHSGQFEECVEKFKLLCKLEPDNRDFREFLQTSEQELHKREQAKPETPQPPESHPSPPQGHDKGPSLASQKPAKRPLVEPPARRESKELAAQPERSAQVEAGSKTKRLTLIGLVAGALLFGAIIGKWLTTRPKPSVVNPEFQTEPEGTSALLSREPNAGPEKLKIPPSREGELQSSASTLFEQGKFLEASRKCDSILEGDAENRFALGLKQEIRARLARLASQAVSANRWDEARTAWNNVLQVVPTDSEAIRQLKVVRTKMKKQEESVIANKVELQLKIQDLRRQISAAMSSKNYLPPNSGNAFELIRELNSLSPGDSLGKERLDQIYLDVLTQTHRKIQSRDLVGASAMAQQIQNCFPERAELKSLRETLKAEEAKLMEARSILVQRAESAMTSGHYIAPANDNTVAYCNQILMVDPQNQKALALKGESLTKASAQAQESIQKGKFEEASGIYSSLLYLAQNESRFPFTAQDLKREIERLEFTAYPVVHNHTIGSCSGRLRFNGYMIAYVPSNDSKDGFSQKLKEISQVEGGDKLKLQLKDKTYRFEISTATSKEENREKIQTMVQRLTLLTSQKQ